MDSVKDSRFFTVRVSPFGNLRVKAYFQLTAAYRRLSRPSSALSAKAFTLRSFSLEQPSCFSPLIFRSSSKQFQLFCLSFANNCYWVVILEKTIWFFFKITIVRLEDLSSKLTKLFPLLTEKPISVFHNKFFSNNIKFYNYLFVSFSLFGFQ